MDTHAFRSRRVVCVGLRRWKAQQLAPILSAVFEHVGFIDGMAQAAGLTRGDVDFVATWGTGEGTDVEALAQRLGAGLLRMEDGFYRSVGLGSDLIAPCSLVLDAQGIYFDPRMPSTLERLLNGEPPSEADVQRARWVREFIALHALTKYNVEACSTARWNTQGRMVVVVPGQVEDDASIRCGAPGINTNLALLQAVRAARPDAFIVYKPHPDVASLNRTGRVHASLTAGLADHIETRLSVISCIRACDELHTMTSQSGFEALLHGRRVVSYGVPFYAGWGLTEDRAPTGHPAFARRTRRLRLDELVAVSLLRYPLYFDWQHRRVTDCESVLHHLVAARTALSASGELEKLNAGFVRRQLRKAGTLVQAAFRTV